MWNRQMVRTSSQDEKSAIQSVSKQEISSDTVIEPMPVGVPALQPDIVAEAIETTEDTFEDALLPGEHINIPHMPIDESAQEILASAQAHEESPVESAEDQLNDFGIGDEHQETIDSIPTKTVGETLAKMQRHEEPPIELAEDLLNDFGVGDEHRHTVDKIPTKPLEESLPEDPVKDAIGDEHKQVFTS